MEPLIGLGGAGALVTAAGLLFWRFVRNILKTQDRRIRRLERDNRWCNLRLDTLITVCRQSNIAIPATLYEPPDWLHEEEDGV